MSRRTIWTDGIEFECAEADGEILSVELGCRAEFLDAYGDKWSGNGLPEPTDAEIVAWATEHLEPEITWPLWSEADRNGVSNSDFYRSRP